MLTKGTETLQNFSLAIENEWLETNGLGGWSSASIIGCNTRRYHGLLVAATVPPTERMVLVSKLDETLVCANERYELSTNDYGDAIHPAGYRYITSFSKDLFPVTEYAAGGITLRKTIAMVQAENTTVIKYDVVKAPHHFALELLPLMAIKYYHSLAHATDTIDRHAIFNNDILQFQAFANQPKVFIKIPGGSYEHNPNWYYNFNYAVEKERGLDYTEDLFSPGKLTVQLQEGDSIAIILSDCDPTDKNGNALLAKEEARKRSLLQRQPAIDTVQQLILAADQFIVQRTITGSEGAEKVATVIAGYHWFTDWSRDTMISLPGLALGMGRYEDAKKILLAFKHSISMGMLPNRFSDQGGVPEYNTVDGTLWYFIAVFKYYEIANDKTFVLSELLPALKDIIAWHISGTRYNIHMDDDGLLYAGETGQQLTWMDAKADNWVVTPRMGKPVEVQALWYNALKILSAFLQMNHQEQEAADTALQAGKAKESFERLFWYEAGNYLYDVIDEAGVPNEQMRPNQLFAISLPFALIEGERAAMVLKVVSELYTPVGLKSLAPGDPQYISVYAGNRLTRDGAYHQGTVWSWLIGPYIDALVKVKGVDGVTEAKKLVEGFHYHLNEACIGSVSEIFDAAAPYHPRGCIAQAWGVAEWLRVITEYRLL